MLGQRRRLHQGVFQRRHVGVRAGQHFLKHDVRFAQPLEQSGGVGAQHRMRFQHFLDSRGCSVLRLRDRLLGGIVELVHRAGDNIGRRFTRLLIMREISLLLSIIVRVKAKPFSSIALTA